MVFKTRSLLKKICPGQENLLVTRQGSYAWNAAIDVRLDVEEFSLYCQNARKESGEEQMETLLQAVDLYKGDFLSGNDDDWTVPLRRYYQILYLDACKQALPLL